MSMRLIASNIWKRYDDSHVLRACSFVFDNPGIYVLTGANGCGKSTFLRICALIERPDRGEINYFSDGVPLENDLELKRKVTLVLPRVGVFNTSVFKNVVYGLKIRGVTRQRAEDMVGHALDFAGLSHKSNQNALTLSSGETQRLGIARAMVVEPQILFLDEPTASVDQKNTVIIEDIILRMRRESRAVVVIATHDREQARRLADCLMVLDEGRIDVVSRCA